jgi:hypothetical protein
MNNRTVQAISDENIAAAELEIAAMGKILNILKTKLENPEQRARVLGAVAVLYGYADANFPEDAAPLR